MLILKVSSFTGLHEGREAVTPSTENLHTCEPFRRQKLSYKDMVGILHICLNGSNNVLETGFDSTK